MNKGLLIHIIAFVVSAFCIMYVIQGDDSSMAVRGLIVIMLGMVQFVAAIFNTDNDSYKKKL